MRINRPANGKRPGSPTARLALLGLAQKCSVTADSSVTFFFFFFFKKSGEPAAQRTSALSSLTRPRFAVVRSEERGISDQAAPPHANCGGSFEKSRPWRSGRRERIMVLRDDPPCESVPQPETAPSVRAAVVIQASDFVLQLRASWGTACHIELRIEHGE